MFAGLEPGDTWFVTLTQPGDADPASSFEKVSAAFRLLVPKLRRAYGPLEYFAVVELQARGAAHVHALARGARPSLGWLRAAAKASGFGSEVDVQHGGSCARTRVPSRLRYRS
jgi:hypothetical protein